jgi:hypothetical protein
MRLLTWLRAAICVDQTRRSHRQGRRRKPSLLSRLTLEALEDRCTPTTLSALGYSTYLGISSFTYASANAVAVDGSGNTYVTGYLTQSSGPNEHAFAAKFRPDGSLAYWTVLGGSGAEYGLGIAVDSAGDAYVTGETTSADFPTLNAFQSTYGGNGDAFLTRLDPTGAILYSSYLGGSSGENGLINNRSGSIAVDNSGAAYLTGTTGSTNFPTSSNAYQPILPAGGACFVTKLNTNLSGAASLVYSTYLSGSYESRIALDSAGDAFVASNNMVTKLNPDGSAVLYSTQLNGETITGIAVDGSDNAYVTGLCSTCPTTPGAFQTASAGSEDAFVSELNPSGSGLVYSTYLGSAGFDNAAGITLDSAGHVFVTGWSATAGFPTRNAFDPITGGAFVAELDPTQSGTASLVWSSYLGNSNAQSYSVAVDGSENVLVVGKTSSTSFPTVNAYEPTSPGGPAGFLTKILPPPVNTATTTTLVSSSNPATVGQSVTFTATVTSLGPGAGTPDGTVAFLDGVTRLGSVAVDANGQAAFTTNLAAGSHNVEAIYLGSLTFGESSTPTLLQLVQQPKQASSTTLTSSLNPSTFGQPITLTATVQAASGSGKPTGTVTFMDGSTTLGTETLNNKGVATLSISTLAVGSNALSVTYNGDGTFASGASGVLSQVVKQAASKTTLASSPTTAPPGQAVTFTATVVAVAPGAGSPTGTVTFLDGSTVLGTVTLSNGQAMFTTAVLTKGKHTIKAIYNGDADFDTSTSAALTETIQ